MRINKMITMRKIFDLLSNSLNQVFKEMHRDQFGEFVSGYWGLKGQYRAFSLTWPASMQSYENVYVYVRKASNSHRISLPRRRF